MNRLRCVLLLAALAVAPAGGWAAETLPVPEAGIMGDVPGGQEQPDPGLDYKIVFDVHVLGDAGSVVDPALQAMGKLVNTFRNHGVPASHLHMVAMFHGPAILMVTNDRTYGQRTDASVNPNDTILRHLKDAGVDLAVCGQSARAQHYDQASLLPFVHLNFSAVVTFINLAMRGYVRVTE